MTISDTAPVEPAAQTTDPAPADDQATAPAETPPGDGLESLPESWQREVKLLRKENADRRTKSNELQALLDSAKTEDDLNVAVSAAVEKYQAQLAELERTIAIQQHTQGLPEGAAELVTGTTEEEIKASAEKVRKLLEGAGTPDPDLEASGGLNPRASDSAGQSPRELARAALNSGRRR